MTSTGLSFRTDPEAALAEYFERGLFVEPPGLWTDAQIDELVRATEALPQAQDGSYKPCMHPHRVNDTFLGALCNPNIVGVMEKLLGGKVSGIQSELFFCVSGTHGFAAHQDNHYVEAKEDAFASAWTALQDVTVESGALIMWPGTHREPILPTEPLPARAGGAGQDPNANRQQAVVSPRFKPVDVPVPKGAVVFLHGHTVHASHDNRSDHFRRALLMTYIRRGERFRPGNHAKRAEVNVYSSHELQR